jgi:putative ABC transport system permease protein
MNFIWLRTWQIGAKSLLLHPLRSLLTVLGIFIGVASVIWLLAIGEGISRKAQEQIEGLGANNIIVRSVKPPQEATGGGSGGPIPYGVRRADYRALKDLSTIASALQIREIRRRFIRGGKIIDGRLVGCTPEYAEVTKLEVDRGHFITPAEYDNKEAVCVLSSGVADRLFGFENPIGESIRIEESFYKVVGVMKFRNPTAGIGGSLAAQDFNDDVYIPYSTLQTRIGDFVAIIGSGSFQGEIVELSQITLRVNDTSRVMETADLVRDTFDRTHKQEDYAIVVPLELLEQARTTRMMFILFMGMIAAISLIVGGIGIMNIMLATVTERTREIGIRRALGAKRSDITRQFLAETVLLSVCGGIVGILGGITCGPLINTLRWGAERFFPDIMNDLPDLIRAIEPVVVPWSIPVAFGIAVCVGLVFGLYPAMRAAAKDPVESLRHE